MNSPYAPRSGRFFNAVFPYGIICPGREVTAVKIVVMGTDKRFEYLKERLSRAGHVIVGDAADAELAVTNYPFPAQIPDGISIAACGPKLAPAGVLDIMKDEDYQLEIAYMTAEGAISAAMANTRHTIRGARCMVIGWGRIGRALTHILKRLGADVTVLTRRMDAAAEIISAGAVAEATENAASAIVGQDVVFSTPPAMVADKTVLENAERGAVVIDLASPPYGVDLDSARETGVRAWREGALPGRYCPQNAAAAIYDALVRGGAIHG